jgi:hypothetical protein
MTISGDYPTPVLVNGYVCKNCTDVDDAKRHIDPAHPKDGPYGIYAKDDPAAASRSPAVDFGGGLTAPPPGAVPSTNPTVGVRLDVSI